MSAFQRLFLSIVAMLIIGASAAASLAVEPCLLAYPTGQTVFRYDPNRYEVLESSDLGYDPLYSLAGQTLWDKHESRVAVEIYRAPGLSGFQPSTTGRSEFFHTGSRGILVIDGFSRSPRQLSDVCVQFTPRPGTASIEVSVNGTPVTGLRYLIPSFVVSTPTSDGFYSSSLVLNIDWTGALEMEVLVFSDRNGNRIFDGDPAYRVLMHDFTVPTETSTWGGIKAIYSDQ